MTLAGSAGAAASRHVRRVPYQIPAQSYGHVSGDIKCMLHSGLRKTGGVL